MDLCPLVPLCIISTCMESERQCGLFKGQILGLTLVELRLLPSLTSGVKGYCQSKVYEEFVRCRGCEV